MLKIRLKNLNENRRGSDIMFLFFWKKGKDHLKPIEILC